MPMTKIKLIIITVFLALFGALCAAVFIQNNKIRLLNDSLLVATANNKAYEAERDSLRKNAIQFQFTIDQLNHSQDSLVLRIKDIKSKLNIKDKQIEELQYFVSTNNKRDSVIVRDTIFQYGVALDTLIGDKWSSLAIHAEYPNILDVDYSFRNESLVILHNSRVTVDPPKKCWIGRLFQKKQNIVEVDVVQENPYCENKEQKFIKIIK